MSHFTTVETQIRDLVILKQVLEQMGYKVHDDHRKVRGYHGQLADAELCIDTKSSYDIGVVKTQSGYSFIGDWDMLEVRAGVEKNAFLKAVNKNYAYKKVMAEVKKRGYQVVEEKTDERQTVSIRVRKFS
ncbi:DUF1257 domain-containing protein [bacterium]|nr:DUF1257 domain-containing protein [bacterium]